MTHLDAMTRPLLLALGLLVILQGAVRGQSVRDYVIGPEDVLAIAVFDQADLNGKYAVELDGSFAFPLIGRVKAGGLTIKQFEHELKTRLADGFFKDPQIAVGIEQYRSRRVYVVGEVRNPGAYTLTGDMTLIEALARAGSTTQHAHDEVLVVRGGEGTHEAALPDAPGREATRINLTDLQSGAANGLNVSLRDGDTIYVARAELVYVFGQVKSPGSYSITSNTTVLQALSLAGGVTPYGAMNRTRIIRALDGDKTRKKEFRVKLSDIVRPGDTILVPERLF
jgi:polysaccharide biosynthesis/export protein